jgi:hypothetical protein
MEHNTKVDENKESTRRMVVTMQSIHAKGRRRQTYSQFYVRDDEGYTDEMRRSEICSECVYQEKKVQDVYDQEAGCFRNLRPNSLPFEVEG